MTDCAHQKSNGLLWALRCVAQHNDAQAWSVLVADVGPSIHRLAVRLTGDHALAEDIMQETFMLVRDHADRFVVRDGDGDDDARHWIIGVAANASLHLARRHRLLINRDDRAGRVAMMTATPVPAPSQSAEDSDDGRVLRRELAELPIVYGQALILHYFACQDYSQLASDLRVSVNTIRSRVNRGLKLLRERLERCGVTLSIAALTGLLSNLGAAPVAAVALPASAFGIISSSTIATTTMAGASTIASGGMILATVLSTVLAATITLMGWASGWFSSPTDSEPAKVPASVVESPRHSEAVSKEEPVPVEPPVVETVPVPSVRVLGTAPLQAPANVKCLAISPDGRSVAVGLQVEYGRKNADGIVVWDVASLSERLRIKVPGTVTYMRYLSDGRRLLFMTMVNQGDEDRTILWDLEENREILSLEIPNSHGSFTLTPDERILLAPEGKIKPDELMRPRAYQYPGPRAHLAAWDLTNGQRLPGIDNVARQETIDEFGTTRKFEIQSVGLNRDGTTLACYEENTGFSFKNNTEQDRKRAWVPPPPIMTVWQWPEKKRLHGWEFPRGYRPFGDIEWLASGDALIVRAEKGKRELMLILRASDGAVLNEFDGIGTLSHDGKSFVAYANGRVSTYDLSNVTEKRERDAFTVGDALDNLYKPSVGRDGRYLVGQIWNSNSFALIDLQQKKLLAPIGAVHREQPHWLLYSPDGRLHAFDGSKVWIYGAKGELVQNLTIGYCFADLFGPDGRLLVCGGSSKGQTEVWDSVTGRLLGKLPKVQKGGLENVFHSRDARWSAVLGEYDGTLQFLDFLSNTRLGAVTGPSKGKNSYEAEVERCLWDASGERVYIADKSAMWFNEDDRKELGMTGPIGLSGVFDPRTGERLFWFSDDAGKPIEMVSEMDLCEARGVLYLELGSGGSSFGFTLINGKMVQQADAMVCGLWSMADGRLVRRFEHLGRNTRFNHDGSLLVGYGGVIDLASGERVQTFGKVDRFDQWGRISGTGTLIASFHEDAMVRVTDIRTGVELFRRSHGVASEQPKGLTWHPAETQIAIQFGSPAVAQVDLYDQVEKAKEVSPAAMAKAVAALADKEVTARADAVRLLIACGEACLESLKAVVAQEDASIQARRMALHVAECLARDGGESARAWIGQLAAGAPENLIAGCARDALARLAAAVRATELSRKNREPSPLVWPPNAPPQQTLPDGGNDF